MKSQSRPDWEPDWDGPADKPISTRKQIALATLAGVSLFVIAIALWYGYGMIRPTTIPNTGDEVCGPVNNVFNNGAGQWFATINGTTYFIQGNTSTESGMMAGDLMYAQQQNVDMCVSLGDGPGSSVAIVEVRPA